MITTAPTLSGLVFTLSFLFCKSSKVICFSFKRLEYFGDFTGGIFWFGSVNVAAVNVSIVCWIF